MADDYMSDDIIMGISQSSSTGLSVSREQKRRLNIERHRDEAEMRLKKRVTRDDIEKERREEGLKKPIGEESKGFALLAKMGYKPGMTLGRKKDTDATEKRGLREPISMDVKVNRKGLGHEAHEEGERNSRVEQHMAVMREQAKKNEELIAEYKDRRRAESSIKTIYSDIQKSRKACLELDVREGLKSPQKFWFWKSYKRKEEKDAAVYSKKVSEEVEEYFYSDGSPALPEPQWFELEKDNLLERLVTITDYLRTRHSYCIWCGCQFENSDEMTSQCPGDSRSIHDCDDEF
ncbi:unnamed protein product [Caenorhabditis auriculariae]|uniref:G patch domain-containing protein 11 n=1 Tax=Caenorhabditis auriculariae TaxID=2777116 RepID=A0A8S1GV59_9PELO|nr:unnamed protein product [Caenorhabditis auriculariae]